MDAKKNQINFDSELLQFEEVRAAASRVDEVFEKNPSFLHLKNQFDKSLSFFYDAYQKNQELLQISQEKNAVILANSYKISTILKVAQTDSETLKKYKSEYENAKSVIQSIQGSEKKSREIVNNLRATITTLSNQIGSGDAFCYGEEDSVGTIIQDVANLKSECQSCNNEISNMKQSIAEKKKALNHNKEEIEKCRNFSEKYTQQISENQSLISKAQKEIKENRKSIQTCEPEITSEHKTIKEKSNLIKNQDLTICQKRKTSIELDHQIVDVSLKGKHAKQSIDNKIKQRDQLIHSSKTINDVIEKVNRDIELCQNEFDIFTQKLDEENSFIEQNTSILQSIQSKLEKTQQEKKNLQIKVRDLQNEFKKLQNEKTIGEDQRTHKIRILYNSQKSYENEKLELKNNKLQTEDIILDGKNISHNSKLEKEYLQGQKVKLKSLESEIERKTLDIIQINAHSQLATDEKQTYDEKNHNDTKYLKKLQKKVQKQNLFVEQIRKEKNEIKLKLNQLEKENKELNYQIKDLTQQIDEITQNIKEKEMKSIDNHFNSKSIRQEILFLTTSSNELKELLSKTNHSISSLETQHQLLHRVLHENKVDFANQKKEYISTISIRNVFNGNLIDRKKEIQNLHSEIISLINIIKKCKLQYEQKCNEISKYNKEIKDLLELNKELQLKVEKLNIMELEHKNLINLNNQEIYKNAILIKETSLPRNIHRWEMLKAVDPEYVKRLRYLSRIYSKIDVAHKKLIKLKEIKNDLEKQLENKKKQIIPNGFNEYKNFQRNIQTYKNDLMEKEKKIQEMNKEIEENQKILKEINNNNYQIRDKITKRKSNYFGFKNKKMTKNVSSNNVMFFMTEPDIITLGGGFTNINNKTVKNEIQKNDTFDIFPLNEISENSPRKQKNRNRKILIPKRLSRTSYSSERTKKN